jgi:hypothetical protein
MNRLQPLQQQQLLTTAGQLLQLQQQQGELLQV